MVERTLRKAEVAGSIPATSSTDLRLDASGNLVLTTVAEFHERLEQAIFEMIYLHTPATKLLYAPLHPMRPQSDD